MESILDNTNNSASPPSQESMPPKVSKKRKSDHNIEQKQEQPKKLKKQKEKVVKLTTSELQNLMNTTIANYEKSKSQTAKDVPMEPQSKSNSSVTTVYSRLCPPGPSQNLEGQPQMDRLTTDLEAMDVDTNNLSDDSLAVQLNSSDELPDNIIAGQQLPLPPPPPAN